MQLNNVMIVGNAVRDPEVKQTPKGTPVATVSLGVNETFNGENGKRQVTTFVDVEAWGPSAENLGKLVKKGQEVFVEGVLRQDQWDDKETGQKRSRLFLKAERWQLTQYRANEQARQQSAPAPGMQR
jgi:single-strand DNA-binding protein